MGNSVSRFILLLVESYWVEQTVCDRLGEELCFVMVVAVTTMHRSNTVSIF